MLWLQNPLLENLRPEVITLRQDKPEGLQTFVFHLPSFPKATAWRLSLGCVERLSAGVSSPALSG